MRKEKVLEIASFFTSRKHSLVMKQVLGLIYLAERSCLEKYGYPMVYDRIVKKDGIPLMINTENALHSQPPEFFLSYEWEELSQADNEILEDVWTDYGMNMWAIHLYQHLASFTEMETYSDKITYLDILQAVWYDKSEDQIQAAWEEIQSQVYIDEMFRNLGKVRNGSC